MTLTRDEAEKMVLEFEKLSAANDVTGDTIYPLAKARAALIAALTAPAGVPVGYIAMKQEAWDFLCGMGDLDGIGFGEKHPTRAGAFWWRSFIGKNMLATAPQPPKVKT